MISFTVPGEAPSTPNLREHYMVRARRTKAQRAKVARLMPKWVDGPLLVIRLTRVAPRHLDTDNLAAALKGHRDAVAAKLRIDDATPLVRWEYEQRKGEPAVEVVVMEASWSALEATSPTRGKALATVTVDARKRLSVVRAPGAGRIRAPLKPRPTVEAAREAEETFAPGPLTCKICGCQIRAMDAGMCNTCLEDRLILGKPCPPSPTY